MDIDHILCEKGARAKGAARQLATTSATVKNRALAAMADALDAFRDEILLANARDVDAAQQRGVSRAFIDRLLLTPVRIAGMAEGLRAIAALADPIGEVLGMWRRPNGLDIGKVRVPLGVVGIIYEARPNVTVDAAGLCLKAGNAVILRGGSEAIHSNLAITNVISKAATAAGLPEGAIQLIEITDREAVNRLLKLNQYIDVIIPRGGAGLIRTVVEQSTVPVIETGVGNCHIYIDRDAELAMAQAIVLNAKCQRPGVCNAAETLLVHEAVAPTHLPPIIAALETAGVEIRGCQKTQALHPGVKPATEVDWETEYLDLILAVKVVKDMDEALAHIARYGTRHSEAIVTSNYTSARRFLAEVDAAAVYVNASTRFTDGFEFGFGAEIGISTQKLHARGPMGLEELTSIKYVIYGDGQVRE